MKLATLVLLILALASPSAFAVTVFTASMSGTNEVPPNASSATGFSTITVDGDSLTVEISWDGLLGGNPAAAHIHCCVDPGNNVGVAVGFPAFPATTSGTYTHTFNLLDPSIYTAGFRTNFGGGTAAGAQAALLAGLLAGRAYTNIHNEIYPGGEIRGVLVQAPEPGTFALLGLSLVGLGFMRRRQV